MLRRRWIFGTPLVLFGLLVGAEIACRSILDLGDPPLAMTDPDIEYRMQPSKAYEKHGNRISYNAYSMRSDDFPRRRTDPTEVRVMMLGDSVVNGHTFVDQEELASEVLKSGLAEKLGRDVVVGNVSCGSWGPPNVLAYIERFGLFDADAVVLVLSGHDAADVPTFEGLPIDFPSRRPVLALEEFVWKLWTRWTTPEERVATQAAKAQCLAAIGQIARYAKDNGADFVVVLHSTLPELDHGEGEGLRWIREFCMAESIVVVSLRGAFAVDRWNGKVLYRDDIHTTAAGQRVMAEVLLEYLSPQLSVRREEKTGPIVPGPDD